MNTLLLRLIILCIVITGMHSGFSQCEQEEYKIIIRLATHDLKVRNYELGIQRLLDAQNICPDKREEVSVLIKQAFAQIEGEKAAADRRANETQSLLLVNKSKKALNKNVWQALNLAKDAYKLTIPNSSLEVKRALCEAYEPFQQEFLLKYDILEEKQITSLAIAPDKKTLVLTTKSGFRDQDFGRDKDKEYPNLLLLDSNLNVQTTLPGISSDSWGFDDEFVEVKAPLMNATFDSEMNSILYGTWDGKLELAPVDGKEVQLISQNSLPVSSLDFSPDNQWIIAGGWEGALQIFNKNTTQPIIINDAHDDFINVALFSPDGNQILTAGQDGWVKLWNKKGTLLLQFKKHTHSISSAVFSKEGNRILTGSWDGRAILWNHKGESIQEFNHGANINAVDLSEDGQYVLTGGWDNLIKIWDIKGNLINELEGHEDDVISVNFVQNGLHIVSASSGIMSTKSESVFLWKYVTPEGVIRWLEWVDEKTNE